MHSMPDDKVKIALVDNTQPSESLTIVGDWFLAESVSATIGKGIRQTIFTRHAPSIKLKLEMFDQELNLLIEEQAGNIGESRESAMNKLSNIAKNI